MYTHKWPIIRTGWKDYASSFICVFSGGAAAMRRNRPMSLLIAFTGKGVFPACFDVSFMLHVIHFVSTPRELVPHVKVTVLSTSFFFYSFDCPTLLLCCCSIKNFVAEHVYLICSFTDNVNPKQFLLTTKADSSSQVLRYTVDLD